MTDLIARAALKVAAILDAGGPGSGPQGGGGGGSSSSSSGKTHSVKLPANRSKITITHASKAMSEMGFKLGAGKSSIVGGKFVTTYSVTLPDGSTKSMGTDEMKSLIYSGAAK